MLTFGGKDMSTSGYSNVDYMENNVNIDGKIIDLNNIEISDIKLIVDNTKNTLEKKY
jgi:hypothetical protein